MLDYLPQFKKINEPVLRFSHLDNTKKSISPIEGLFNWGPYDKTIPNYLSPTNIRIAMITADYALEFLFGHMKTLNSHIRKNSEDDYLKDYSGFEKIYKTKLSFPESATSNLVQLITSTEMRQVEKEAQPEIAFLNLLKQKITNLKTERHLFDLIVLHIPKKLSVYNTSMSESFSFDLHDAVKAYCAPNAIKIQIVQDSSLENSYEPARIAWWLSLAIYVKANGIPWKLDQQLEKTAYVGLAFGIKATRGEKKIVIGCSQIFDESGEGLKFLLFPLENPIWFSKNPHMSANDARKLFQIVRKTYQDLNHARPHRIVVHKTVHFLDTEIKGITEALEGVEDVELLTIENSEYRAIQSEKLYNQQKQEVSSWPIYRGTALPLNEQSFLLWTQGDVRGVSGPNRHYYKDKRNIPAPVVIKKFRGKMDIDQISEDVLKLTKMNWNNLEFYNREPVTISFAKTISDIVKQLDEYYQIPYDFRYFI